METTEATSRFLFLGNALCLDFVNTERMRDGERVDLIEDADDLWAWIVEAGAMTPEAAEDAAIQVTPQQALAEARELRVAVRGMVEAIVCGEPVSKEAVAVVNAHLIRRRGYSQLTLSDDGIGREFRAEYIGGQDFLYAVAESAAEILANGDWGLIRKCESARCILFFYDTTKNHGRRWCSMEGCGNRHKAAEHYRRRRAKNAPYETLGAEKPL
ncbi:MAG: ABATE domain-containing protein [Capsulimonas sp.]|uniref:CGNR zinc finger domain-containing protein n=1 Tax=Capsulimonas sp. TaxID=2494211 RepID=UPI003266D64B